MKVWKAFANDRDSIDVLPLSIVPLKTEGLRKARIVKNSRLEGMVELFSGRQSGSGQIPPRDLPTVFEFREDNEHDLDVVERLCGLPTYDVYSLRILLRHENITVDQHEQLRLSAEAQSLLEPHMHVFTRPLIKAVYGDEYKHGQELQGLTQLFANPDTDKARHNLVRIAEMLEIELPEVPAFLDDYADVYLSLAYYQHHLEEIASGLSSFLEITRDLRMRRRNSLSKTFLTACDRIEEAMVATTAETKDALEHFQILTADMWTNISQGKFEAIRELITQNHTVVGGNLCVLSVKLNTWIERDGGKGLGRDETAQHFILSEMLPGIDKITETSFPAPDAALSDQNSLRRAGVVP